MEIISKEQAVASGAKHFYTGVPCKNGHLALRRVIKGDCTECSRQWAKDNYIKNKPVDTPIRVTMTDEERKKAHRQRQWTYVNQHRAEINHKARKKIWNDPKLRERALDWIVK